MSKILKFPAKSGVYLLIAATATGVGLQFSPNSADSFLTSSSKFTTLFHGVLRSSRAISTVSPISLSLINTIFLRGMNDVNLNLNFVLQIACTVVDYKYSLHGLPLDSDDYLRVLSEVFFSFFKILSLSLSFCVIAWFLFGFWEMVGIEHIYENFLGFFKFIYLVCF